MPGSAQAASRGWPMSNSLTQIPLFKSVDEATLRSFEGRVNWAKFEESELVIDYDDNSNDVYFIVSGPGQGALPHDHRQGGHPGRDGRRAILRRAFRNRWRRPLGQCHGAEPLADVHHVGAGLHGPRDPHASGLQADHDDPRLAHPLPQHAARRALLPADEAPALCGADQPVAAAGRPFRPARRVAAALPSRSRRPHRLPPRGGVARAFRAREGGARRRSRAARSPSSIRTSSTSASRRRCRTEPGPVTPSPSQKVGSFLGADFPALRVLGGGRACPCRASGGEPTGIRE